MYFRWKPYVPVAARRQKAAKTAARLAKKGQALSPVTASRGAIAKSFWGNAWCENLERYSDYSNRLPRGRTYLRNGSVIDLKIQAGEVTAQVMGSSLYRIKIKISQVVRAHWQGIARDCAQSIDTLVELLQGKLSASVMERITRPGTGLFPSPKEIGFSCSCPDSAAMCKHIAAALYGIGARLDLEPELLFGLRNVDAKELIARAGEGDVLPQGAPRAARILDSSKLADVFGIDLPGLVLNPAGQPSASNTVKRKRPSSPRKSKAVAGLRARSGRTQPGKVLKEPTNGRRR
jgi:uncharacterized Zn finger protein